MANNKRHLGSQAVQFQLNWNRDGTPHLNWQQIKYDGPAYPAVSNEPI